MITATMAEPITPGSNAKFNFMTRYEIEDTWDFGFVQISTDWTANENGFYVDDIIISDDNGELQRDDLESGSNKWILNGWEYTTGLVKNDWEITFINPIYNDGKFSRFGIQDGNMFISGNYQKDFTSLDTKNLNRDVVTIVLSNHLPEDKIFPSRYTLLVEKGSVIR